MSVVLLSGGIDSVVNLAELVRISQGKGANANVLALTINYGQRAWIREETSAKKLSAYYGVEWRSVDVSWLAKVQSSSLTNSEAELPHFTIAELADSQKTIASMQSVWVANRNAIFLSIAAAFAEARGSNEVYAGFNIEEASTFKDNSQAFLDAMSKAFRFSTLTNVEAKSVTIDLDKKEIFARAIALEIPLEHVWSCYTAGPTRCWRCESCVRTENALLQQGESGIGLLNKLKNEILSN